MRRVTLEGPRGRFWFIDVPVTRRERFRGLRGRTRVQQDHGMLFQGCRSVHTFGMRSPIGVAALDRDLIARWVGTLRPRRVLLPRRGVRMILEFAPDADVRVGDRLVPRDRSDGWSEV